MSSLFPLIYVDHRLVSFQNRSTGALVISGLLDFLTFALCPPYRYGIQVIRDLDVYAKRLKGDTSLVLT